MILEERRGALFFGNCNEYFDLFILTLSAVGMNGVHRKWFMSQKYWYTRAWAQGLEKEKQETTKLCNRLSEYMSQKKKKKKKKGNVFQKETLQAGFFAGANRLCSALI